MSKAKLLESTTTFMLLTLTAAKEERLAQGQEKEKSASQWSQGAGYWVRPLFE